MRNKTRLQTAPITALLLLSLLLPVLGADKEPAQAAYIDNGQVRLGVDLGAGGGIFYFSEKTPERNLLNHADKGRFIQQSYYGRADGSMWDKQPWRWNPVQGGGWRGEPAKVLESSIQADKLYVKTLPKHWATGEDVPEAVMEEWIELHGKIAQIHFRFSYHGTVNQPPADAELPAFFADGALPNLVFYSGTQPWTGGDLTRIVPGWPNHGGTATESWAAYVDDKDWGIGLFFPGKTRFTYYRFKGNGQNGPTGSACSYFAPLSRVTIVNGFVYDYTIDVAIGTVPELRDTFKTLAASLPPPAAK